MKKRNKNYPYYDNIKYNNLYELFTYKSKTVPNKIAISYMEDGKKIEKTYLELYNDILNISKYLNNKYKNKHIAIIGENSYNWIVLFLGIILSGNVAVPIDKDLDIDKINKLIKKSDVKIAYYSKYYIPYIDKLKIKTYPIEEINKNIEEGKTKENNYLNNIDNHKLACIFFTSGTTGFNKGVMLSEYNITSDIYGASSLFKPNGKVISILPYHHAFGLITAVLMPINYEEEVYINKSLKNLMRDFSLIKPNIIFVVPAFIENFYKQINRNARKMKKEKTLNRTIKISKNLRKIGIDIRKQLFKEIRSTFGNLEYIICGGAYLNPKYIKWFRELDITILNGYGITECSPVLSVNRNNYYNDESVGVPCKGDEIKIIDGQISVKGDNVFLGYYKEEEETKKTFKNNYFLTGDLGYIKDDFIYITGREKNIIVLSNGENISPEEIEEELLKDDGVSEVVVYEKDNKLVCQIYPNDEYLNDNEYFNKLINNYNIDKPMNRKITNFTLRKEEFIKNTNNKILRDKVEENDK